MAAQECYAVYVNRDIRPRSLTINNLNLKHIFLQEYFQTHKSIISGLENGTPNTSSIHTHTHIYMHINTHIPLSSLKFFEKHMDNTIIYKEQLFILTL